MKLTPEQQEIVISYLPYINTMAFNFWRWAHIPARYLDDVKADAVLQLCFTVARFDPDGSYDLDTKIILDVKSHLSKKIRRVYRRLNSVTVDFPEELNLELIIDDHEQESVLDQLVRLLPELTPRQQEIMEARYGLSGDPAMNTRETAIRLNANPETVRTIEYQARTRLKKLMEMNHVASRS